MHERVQVYIRGEERSRNSVWMLFHLARLPKIENHELIGGAKTQRC
jgi:hypothetical protein